jgi:hypothetical protein
MGKNHGVGIKSLKTTGLGQEIPTTKVVGYVVVVIVKKRNRILYWNSGEQAVSSC